MIRKISLNFRFQQKNFLIKNTKLTKKENELKMKYCKLGPYTVSKLGFGK